VITLDSALINGVNFTIKQQIKFWIKMTKVRFLKKLV